MYMIIQKYYSFTYQSQLDKLGKLGKIKVRLDTETFKLYLKIGLDQ